MSKDSVEIAIDGFSGPLDLLCHLVESRQMQAWDWLGPVLGAFAQSADDQQMHLVDQFFPELDYRRFQIDLAKPVEMDAVEMIPRLAVYGDMMGRKILNDAFDSVEDLQPHMID